MQKKQEEKKEEEEGEEKAKKTADISHSSVLLDAFIFCVLFKFSKVIVKWMNWAWSQCVVANGCVCISWRQCMCDVSEWALKWAMKSKWLYRQNIFSTIVFVTFFVWKMTCKKKGHHGCSHLGAGMRKVKMKHLSQTRASFSLVHSSSTFCQFDDVMVDGDWNCWMQIVCMAESKTQYSLL